jgi:hypothetical protein
MLYKDTVNRDLIDVAEKLALLPQLEKFRIAGGTGVALQIGHRVSIDIDLFSNEKVNKVEIASSLNELFPEIKVFVGTDTLRTTIKGVRVELYDEWHTPFKTDPIIVEGIRLASLRDIAAFKLETITERREKKDYIDLYFLFNQLGAVEVLSNFKNYNPHISAKSVLFALGEVVEAQNNKSVMPQMLVPTSWNEITQSMLDAARTFISLTKTGK